MEQRPAFAFFIMIQLIDFLSSDVGELALLSPHLSTETLHAVMPMDTFTSSS